MCVLHLKRRQTDNFTVRHRRRSSRLPFYFSLSFSFLLSQFLFLSRFCTRRYLSYTLYNDFLYNFMSVFRSLFCFFFVSKTNVLEIRASHWLRERIKISGNVIRRKYGSTRKKKKKKKKKKKLMSSKTTKVNALTRLLPAQDHRTARTHLCVSVLPLILHVTSKAFLKLSLQFFLEFN